MNMISIRDVTKSYAGFPALQGISFEVEKGEIFGLLGPNGAGKTTTLSMLCGLLAPTSGTVSIDGHDAVREPDVVKSSLGFVPQELAIYPTLSARENLAFFGGLYGLSGPGLARRVDEALEIVGLRDRADESVKTFSGGMKRRVNLAAGILHRPRLLLLDEPTVGVDPHSRNGIFEALRKLNREGMTIVYTSHYMEEVEALCSRVAILDHGRLVACATLEKLLALVGGGMVKAGLNDCSPALLSSIREAPYVKSADRKGSLVLVATENLQRALAGVLDVVNAAGERLESLQIVEPNLETVFLHLTGSALRD